MGGFLAEVPWGPQLNYWIVLQLLDRAKGEDNLLFRIRQNDVV
jgi:hypothetical protein